MGDYKRKYPLLSACGLNCGLCPRYHTDGTSRCPGCGGEAFFTKRPSCGVLSCARRHGGIEYCYLCEEYPCGKYSGAEQVDSFITHRKMLADFKKVKVGGIEAYQAELERKMTILQTLLAHYNDGRKKSLFCLAVNLLELKDLEHIMKKIETEAAQGDRTEKEKAALAAGELSSMAEKRGISLKLRKKQEGKQ